MTEWPFLGLLLGAADDRLRCLETEARMLREQREAIERVDCMRGEDLEVAVFKADLVGAYIEMWRAYHNGLKRYRGRACPLRRVVDIHCEVIDEMDWERWLDQVSVAGERLSDLLGVSAAQPPASQDALTRALPWVLPLGAILEHVLRNRESMIGLLKIVGEYRPEHHKKAVQDVFKLLQPLQTAGVCCKDFRILLTEFVLCLLVWRSMRKEPVPNVENYQFVESCRLLAEYQFQALELDPRLVERISAHLGGAEASAAAVKEAVEASTCCIRRLEIQVALTSMVGLVCEAMIFLTSLLSEGDQRVGADESFQFFVFTLAVSENKRMASLLKFMENRLFMIRDLLSSRSQFWIAQLRAAFDFVQSRPRTVPPCILLPVPGLEAGGLAAVDEQEVELTGFEICAFPVWGRYPVPAVLFYTGDERDRTIVYRYVPCGRGGTQALLSCKNPVFDVVGTVVGSVVHVSNEWRDRCSMIEVEHARWRDGVREVGEISNLLLMCDVRLKDPRTGALEFMREECAKGWRQRAVGERGPEELVRILQRRLKAAGQLSDEYVCSGVVDAVLWSKLGELVPECEKLDWRSYQVALQAANARARPAG